MRPLVSCPWMAASWSLRQRTLPSRPRASTRGSGRGRLPQPRRTVAAAATVAAVAASAIVSPARVRPRLRLALQLRRTAPRAGKRRSRGGTARLPLLRPRPLVVATKRDERRFRVCARVSLRASAHTRHTPTRARPYIRRTTMQPQLRSAPMGAAAAVVERPRASFRTAGGAVHIRARAHAHAVTATENTGPV